MVENASFIPKIATQKNRQHIQHGLARHVNNMRLNNGLSTGREREGMHAARWLQSLPTVAEMITRKGM